MEEALDLLFDRLLMMMMMMMMATILVSFTVLQSCKFFLFSILYSDSTNTQLIGIFFIQLLHVSTLLCHLQGARSQYLAKLHKYVSAAVGNTI